jgi:hypothetical protein
MIQRPEEKLPVAVLLKSQDGAGKSSFFEFIGKHILTDQYYLAVSMSRLFDKFNGRCAEKLLTVISETRNGEGARYHER